MSLDENPIEKLWLDFKTAVNPTNSNELWQALQQM
jgi:hypothetical protein